MHQDQERDQALIRNLGHAINAILKGYRRRRMEEVGEEIERLLREDSPLHKETWHRMKGWYKASFDRAPPPAPVIIKRIMVERVDLYFHVPPPGKNIPVSVELFQV